MSKPIVEKAAVAAALKLFAEQRISVRVPKTSAGKPVREVESGRMVVEDQRLAEAHVLSLGEEEDGTVVLVTIDGHKYRAAPAKPAAK